MSAMYNMEEVAPCQDAHIKETERHALNALAPETIAKAKTRRTKEQLDKDAKKVQAMLARLAATGANSFGAQSVPQSTRPKKDPTPSLPYQWASMILAGDYGDYAHEMSGYSGQGVVYKWNGVYWEEHAQDLMKIDCSNWLYDTNPERANAQNAANATQYAYNMLGAKKPLPKAAGLQVMAVSNAYLHIAPDGTITVKAPDPALGLTHACKATVSTPLGTIHVPKELDENSLFGAFLAKSVPCPDERALLQEMCAMTFLPRSLHKAVWLWGSGRNGKGVISKIIQWFHARPVVIRLEKLGGDFGLEPIVGASLLVVDEVKRARFDEEVFKPIVSADPVQVNRKHLKSLPVYYNHASVFVTSQDGPFITDNSNGVHERICSMQFKVVIPEEERIPNLEVRIVEEEADVVLDWLLIGMKRLLARGGFPREKELPASVLQQKRQLRITHDQVGAWMDEMGVEHAPTKMSKEAVYEEFAQWCVSDGREPISPNQFWRQFWARAEFQPHAQKSLYVEIKGKRIKQVEVRITGVAKATMGQLVSANRYNEKENTTGEQANTQVSSCEIVF